METEQPAQRLCSEIQLFDLCGLDVCGQRAGRYCTDGEILERFEAIREEDECASELYLPDEVDEVDEVEDAAFDDDEYAEEEP